MSDKPVLVICAHPDDEVLGCGGTIARHVDNNDKVYLLFLAEGVTARDAVPDIDKRLSDIKSREEMCTSSSKILGAQSPTFIRNEDNRLDQIALIDITKSIERIINDIQPSIIYTHHGGDLNIDHRIVHEAVITACRPQPGFSVRAIYCFETLSSTEWSSPTSHGIFNPSYFVDISEYLDTKMEALNCYKHELREYPHSRSLEAVSILAKYRGSSVGMHAAEAFVVIRLLD